MAATNELTIERRGHTRPAARRRANFVIFLCPAIVLTVLFFVIPVVIDIAVSFTDLSRSLRITKFTTEQYQRIFQGDRRLPEVIGLTFIYVFGTLAIFNVTFGLVLALTTTEFPAFSLLAIDSGLGDASEAAKKGIKSVSYGSIPYAS